MKEYRVKCVMTYTGVRIIKADSEDKAYDIVKEDLDSGTGQDDFPASGEFGEVSWDYYDAQIDHVEEID